MLPLVHDLQNMQTLHDELIWHVVHHFFSQNNDGFQKRTISATFMMIDADWLSSFSHMHTRMNYVENLQRIIHRS